MMSRKKSRLNPIFLIGSPIDKFHPSILPNNQDVLARVFYYLKGSKETLKVSCFKTSEEVLQIWKKANVPTIIKSTIMKRLLTLYRKWFLVHKNILRETKCQKKRENILLADLKNLFNISIEAKIQDPRVKQFLKDQNSECVLRYKAFNARYYSVSKKKGIF